MTGESGTGKELVARAVHRLSPRSTGPFLAVNCAAIPESLVESELFGHRSGSFTGAERDHPGLFLRAGSGTVFLDEVSDLSPLVQAKLLRVLQEREVLAVGSVDSVSIDVRLIAASNRDLAADVETGRFRRDLFYRLNTLEIRLLPLRLRPEDIPPLMAHFLLRQGKQHGLPALEVDEETLLALLVYHWPGNVRELEHVLERAAIVSRGKRIGLEHLPENMRESVGCCLAGDSGTLAEALSRYERTVVERVLADAGGNRRKAAAALGISVTSLWRRMREFGLIKRARTNSTP